MRTFHKMLGVILALLLLGVPYFGFSHGEKVVIKSPKPNAVVKGPSVTVTWDLTKGDRADHVHLYLNGKNTGPKPGSSATLTGLKPGRYSLELRVSTKNHKELGPKASEMFTVAAAGKKKMTGKVKTRSTWKPKSSY